MSKVEVESLVVARAKLVSNVEVYVSNDSRIRNTALQVIGATLIEFEAAVREDERAAIFVQVPGSKDEDKAMTPPADFVAPTEVTFTASDVATADVENPATLLDVARESEQAEPPVTTAEEVKTKRKR